MAKEKRNQEKVSVGKMSSTDQEARLEKNKGARAINYGQRGTRSFLSITFKGE